MSLKARMALAVAAACVWTLVAFVATGMALWADLSVDERAVLGPMIAPRGGLLGVMIVLAMSIAAMGVRAEQFAGVAAASHTSSSMKGNPVALDDATLIAVMEAAA